VARANGKVNKDLFAILMKEITRTIRSMDKVYSSGQVATGTKANTLQMREMDMVKCTGWTKVAIRANGLEVYRMVMAKCSFLMGLLKKATLKIIYSRFISNNKIRMKLQV